MLNTISWKEYLSALAFVIVCYYILVAWLYYKKEILKLLGITILEPDVIPAASLQQFNNCLKKENNSDYLPKEDNSGTLQTLEDEIIAFLEAYENATSKEGIINGLTAIVRKYPSLHHPSFRIRVNQLFLLAANHNGISNLEADELEAIWKQVR